VTTVRVQPTADGLTYFVRFRYDADLVELIKLLPQRARRWDKVAGCWRVNATYIEDLLDLLRVNGCRIIGGPQSSRTVTSWADDLYAAVGLRRVDQVHRALTKVLHPDTDTGDVELMKQLNAARDRMAAAR
jgi:hypothetical protein